MKWFLIGFIVTFGSLIGADALLDTQKKRRSE